MRILAIETSCDDTGIAILEINPGGQPRLLADLVSSQTKIHAPWGGVVPTLAKREHQKNLLPLFKKALTDTDLSKIQNSKFKIQNYNAKFKILNKILEREPELFKKLSLFLEKYQKPDIDLIAVTVGPGLEPALWVGVNFARALGYFWNLPIIPVNHVEAHIAANWLAPIRGISPPAGDLPKGDNFPRPRPSLAENGPISKKLFPAVCLVVSGGHTQIILMRRFGQYKIIGETRDDAAGEAFDKVAKMLKLGYPGGPAIAAIAAKLKVKSLKLKVTLPRPMINSKDYDFSFSGLKTAVLYFIKKLTKTQLKKLTPAIAAEFQQAVIDVLMVKTLAAARKYQAKTVMLSGGVAANNLLRKNFGLRTSDFGLNFLVPPKNFCTDNAAMVALTAYKKTKNKSLSRWPNWRNIRVNANLKLNKRS